ncbi:MAG: LPS-assembly protein LptD, partial [Bacteroidales bacterium]|nr:LPS-assembly protein LptD [Bacteroidales bacterium]
TIEDVPTPLMIPFGLFPNKKGQRSGIVIPTYGESTQRGFYFENGGYYFAISDHLDFKLVGDIYTLGSWAIKPSANYRKRYKYNGYLNANYAINILGEEGSPDYEKNKDYSIRWIHNQDPKARPNSRFLANVNFVSSQYNKFNPVNSNAYLSNTFQSSINYSTSFSGKYFLNASINHSQNTITNEVDLTLPQITFSVNRFYPFRKKTKIGKLKWYDNISVNYNISAQNRISTYDSLFFDEDIFSKMRNGLKHSVQLSSGSIKLLKHIVWSNNFNYTERWYSQKHVKSWRSDTLYLNEGTVYDYIGTDTIYGFNAARDFYFNTSMSTTIYGMYSYKNGPIKAIRHVMRPSLSFNIRPDFGTQEWGYYKYYMNSNGEKVKYSVYDGFIYGKPPDGQSGAIGLNISNSLEMKIRNRKDTISGTKKVSLIENLSLSTSYDFAKDSLNLSRLTISGYTTLFKNFRINYSSSFDPYAADSAGNRINKFEWEVNRRLFRPEKHNWRLGLSYRFNSEMLTKKKESTAGTEMELQDVNENLDGYVDWSVPWNLSFSYDLNYTTTYTYRNGYWDYDVTTDKKLIQTLSFYGDVNITPKWKLGFRSGYDFENKDFTYTSIDIYRDLHCWEMRFNWIPYGFRQSWNFSINIKSSLLQDLKLDKKKDFRDY